MSIRQNILTLLDQGMAVRDIADQVGVTPNTVCYHRDRPITEARRLPDLRHTVSAVRTAEIVARLLGYGFSNAEIADGLGVSKSTVTYHVRRLNLPTDDRAKRRYDWQAVQTFYDEGHTVRECAAAFGFSSQSWHAAVKRGAITARAQGIPNDELFAPDTHRSRRHLKTRIAVDGLKPQVCERCGLSRWQGAPLSLALHHINGNRHDNRLENLSLLCPNCHSQTDNFAGRNRREAA